MHVAQVQKANKEDPEKPFIEEFLTCPRCFQVIKMTEELREHLRLIANNGITTVRKEEIDPEATDNSSNEPYLKTNRTAELQTSAI